MKSLPAIFIVLLVIGYIVYSFNKEPRRNTARTMGNKWTQLQGKWRIISQISNDHYENEDHQEVINGKSGDYIYFRRSGRADLSLGSDASTSDYSLITDTTIRYGQRIYVIQGLSSTSLSLHYKSTPDTNNRYSEISYMLMKR
jgi:hypothetical protein